MGNTILLLEADVERRVALRRALERRGYHVGAEADSAAGFVRATAALDRPPSAVLVGASVDTDLGRMAKKAFPAARVILEGANRPELVAVGE